MKPSTHRALAGTVDSSKISKRHPDDDYLTAGSMYEIRSAAEVPRGPTDLYNARHRAKQQRTVDENDLKYDTLWMVLELPFPIFPVS